MSILVYIKDSLISKMVVRKGTTKLCLISSLQLKWYHLNMIIWKLVLET